VLSRGVLWICGYRSRRQTALVQVISHSLNGPFVRALPNIVKNIREKVCLGDRERDWSKEP